MHMRVFVHACIHKNVYCVYISPKVFTLITDRIFTLLWVYQPCFYSTAELHSRYHYRNIIACNQYFEELIQELEEKTTDHYSTLFSIFTS